MHLHLHSGLLDWSGKVLAKPNFASSQFSNKKIDRAKIKNNNIIIIILGSDEPGSIQSQLPASIGIDTSALGLSDLISMGIAR
jgi:hypothetical protein